MFSERGLHRALTPMPKLAAPLNRANATQALESFIKERTADKTLAARRTIQLSEDDLLLLEHEAGAAAASAPTRLRLNSKIVIAQPLADGVRRPRAEETLIAVSRAVGSHLELAEVLRQTTRELVRALAADIGSICRLDPVDAALERMARYHEPHALSARAASSDVWERILTKTVRDAGGAVYSSDSARDRRFDHSLLRHVPHRSVLIQPLRVKGHIAGIFALVWTRAKHRFKDAELRLVDAVTQQAAIAIENAELLGEVQKFNEVLERRVLDRTARLRRASRALRASREEIRALSKHLEEIRETERARIAREIHDELGQALTVLKMDLARVSREAGLAAGSPDAARLPLAIDNMITSVRRIASELRPQVLDDLGLLAALEWQSREFERCSGAACRFRVKGEPATIDADRSTALFRIFQEMLTNVARHAGATIVQITLDVGQRSVRLQVRDNGCGMDTVPGPYRKRLGLLGMQERAAAFNGRVRILSAPQKGTVVRVQIPMPAAAGEALSS